MLRIYGCLTTQHDLRLVMLAVVVCLIVCLATANLVVHARESRQHGKLLWLSAAAAIVYGGGIWTTHFVAELAYRPGLPIGYDVGLTLLSLTLAVAIAWIGLYTFLRWTAPLRGGALLGLSVGVTHFVGMAGLRVPADLHWDFRFVLAALAVGGALSMTALRVVSEGASWRHRLAGAALLALAICALHFTGMAALTLVPDSAVAIPDQVIAPELLAFFIAAVTILIITLALAGSLVGTHLQLRAALAAADAANRAKSDFRSGIARLLHRRGDDSDHYPGARRFARRHASPAPCGTGCGRCGEPGQIRFPGEYEPRDPHPDERDHRHERFAPRYGARCPATAVCPMHPDLGRPAARRDQRHPRHFQTRSEQARTRADRFRSGDGDRIGVRYLRRRCPAEAAGDRRGHRSDAPALTPRRPDQAAPSAAQPRRQCREIHARRSCPARGFSPVREQWYAVCRIQCRRYRHRHARGRPCRAVPEIQPGRQLDHPPVRRQRPRSRHLQASGRADGRVHRGREHRRRGHSLLVRTSARAGAGAARGFRESRSRAVEGAASHHHRRYGDKPAGPDRSVGNLRHRGLRREPGRPISRGAPGGGRSGPSVRGGHPRPADARNQWHRPRPRDPHAAWDGGDQADPGHLGRSAQSERCSPPRGFQRFRRQTLEPRHADCSPVPGARDRRGGSAGRQHALDLGDGGDDVQKAPDLGGRGQ